MMTDMEKLTNALLLIAGEKRTGLDQIAKQMGTTNSDRSYDSERLSIAVMRVAESGSSIAHALERIAAAIEERD